MFSFTSNRKQIAELRERLERVEKQVSTFKLDYEELFERVRRNLARLARHEQAQAEAASSSQEGSQTAGGNGQARVGRPLSAREQLIQRQLEARRKGLPMPKAEGGEG